MQTLNNLPADYRLTRYFAPYYEQYSVKALPRQLCVNTRLGRVLKIVNEKAAVPLQIRRDDSFVIHHPEKPVSGREKCFVAFSGGKDGLATAIRAKQDGYQPVLFYIGGVNKSLPSERKHAQDVARAAGFPIIEIKVAIGGNKEWSEHPLKNILILCLMIDEGLKQGATAYAFGSTFDDDSTFGSLDYDLSDSFDMLKAFGFFVRQFIPEFQLLHYMCNTMQSFYTIVKYDRRIIPLLSTCITPDFRKPMIRKHNLAQFPAEVLSATGCGTCYKCADEYLFKQKFGLVRFHPAYAKRCVQAKAQFDTKYGTNDFQFDKRKYNRWGGYDTEEIQVLCDRCGWYIGRLVYDKEFGKWFTDRAYGSHHYLDRGYAEELLERFKSIYDL